MNLFDLTGKVALVTGGAHSIGFGIGVGLARAGATVCFNCTNEESRARGIAAYKAEGIDVHGYVCEVTDEKAVQAAVQADCVPVSRPPPKLVSLGGVYSLHNFVSAAFRA